MTLTTAAEREMERVMEVAQAVPVIVGGVLYGPVEDRRPATNFGVAITTHNRWDVLQSTLAEIERNTPDDVPIVVVDDGSTNPMPEAWNSRFDVVRLPENQGIARAKNRCIEELVNRGVEHLFLFDDDAYPLVDEWWMPYVDSPEPHLMRIFPDLAGPRKLNDMRQVYRGDGHVAYTRPRGVMLYAHRSVLDTVGGMDPGFGKWGYEHGDWSNRIHAAGLTTWRFADVEGSERLIHSLDEHEQVDRTVSSHRERRELVQQNLPRYQAQANSPIYYEYRTKRDVVLTCLFAGKPDPQRPAAKPLTLGTLRKLEESIEAAGIAGRDFLVFTDTTEEQGWAGVNLSDFGADNVYFQRWISYWRWLREHPEVRYVWCVDGTDVLCLRDPFTIEPGKLYVGYEPVKLSEGWLGKNHPMLAVQELIAKNPDAWMLNAGVLGGERALVMGFIHDVVRMYFDALANEFERKMPGVGVGDMGVFNLVGRSDKWASHIVYGSQITTVFKAFEVDATRVPALWAHK